MNLCNIPTFTSVNKTYYDIYLSELQLSVICILSTYISRISCIFALLKRENENMKPQFLIGAVNSGSGKTVLAMGLLRLLKSRKLKVQPFKCGPNFMDVQLHALAGGTDSINLDAFMASRTRLQSIYNTYGEKSDVCITEGTAALFDGYKRMLGSSAELSQVLSIPVILVVNARSISYSVAPILFGFKNFNPSVHVAGVIFNQVSSSVHYSYLREACHDVGLQCLGYIPYDEKLRLPSGHTALTQPIKAELEEIIEKVAYYISQYVDVEKLLKLCTRIFPCPYTLPYTSDIEAGNEPLLAGSRIKIAVARDSAFNFIYKENLDHLYRDGNVQFFSPLYANELPKVDLIYLPGGYPELFARQLHRRKNFLQQLRNYVENGGKVWAEGGGMVLLAKSLTTREGGTAYEMSGVLPIECSMIDTKLQSGYRCARIGNTMLDGYEFRYFNVESTSCLHKIKVFSVKGVEMETPFYRYKNVIAGTTHWGWGRDGLLSLF